MTFFPSHCTHQMFHPQMFLDSAKVRNTYRHSGDPNMRRDGGGQIMNPIATTYLHTYLHACMIELFFFSIASF